METAVVKESENCFKYILIAFKASVFSICVILQVSLDISLKHL